MKFKSQVYTQASGSIGGIVYSHNRGGMYTRGRSIPTNPNTTRQALARAAMNAAVQAWNALTDAQRAGWDNYAQNTPVTNKLGDSIILSGQNQFIRSNAYRIRAGATQVATAPTVYNTGEPPTEITDISFATPTVNVDFELAVATSDDGDVALQLGFSLNAGRTYYGGPYQFGTLTAVPTATSGAAAATANEGDFTVPIVIGARIPIRLVMLYDDGRVSQPFTKVQVIT